MVTRLKWACISFEKVREKKIIDWYRFRLIKSSYILFQEWQYVFILLLQALWTLLEYENIITVFLDQQNYLKDY